MKRLKTDVEGHDEVYRGVRDCFQFVSPFNGNGNFKSLTINTSFCLYRYCVKAEKTMFSLEFMDEVALRLTGIREFQESMLKN